MATQKTVLITGCSEGGIGDALAQEFHKQGLRVFATARNLNKMKHLDAMGIETEILDVTDAKSIQNTVDTISKLTGGKLDFLVNNSGAGYGMPLSDTNTTDAQALFAVNVFGVVAVTNAFLPLLMASKGTLVNNASSAGKVPVSWQAYYNASKAALLAINDSYRMELAPFDITVIAIVTGAVRTNFFANLREVKLPEDSLYAPAREEIEFVLRGEGDIDSVDVGVYAKKVVGNALRGKGAKKHLWVGGSSLFLWFWSTFGWETVWDVIMRMVFHLDVVEKKIRDAREFEEGKKTV